MSNLRYAIAIIGALSLLLGLSLGQIYFQHQRIEQLEFNRVRQPVLHFRMHPDWGSRGHVMDRAREEARREREQKLQRAIQRYNEKLQRWEEWRSTDRGLYIISE